MLTHAVGGLLASSGLTLLIVYATIAHDVRRIVAVSIYGVTLLLMYVASTCYHSAKLPRLKRFLKSWITHRSICSSPGRTLPSC